MPGRRSNGRPGCGWANGRSKAWPAAAAVDTEAFYAARRPHPRPDRVLGLQADGKGIVMRPNSLRPGTAARAERASAKLATRLSPGRNTARKRMAEIVAVYDLEPAPRTAADIIPTRRRSLPGQAGTPAGPGRDR